jgi:hypothetical protein
MIRITTIGLDIAKSIFQVHAIDASNRVVVAKAMRRAQVLAFFAKLEPCLVGIEACGSAHYWAREIGKLGHTVKLMPPKYVKPYVKRGKTDAGDAEAICEAVTRPTMTFVAVKSAEQQALAMLHKVRETLIGQRTQGINAMRGHLSELGVIAPLGLTGLAELAAIVRDEGDMRLPPMARGTLELLLTQIEATGKRIAESTNLRRRAARSKPCRRSGRSLQAHSEPASLTRAPSKTAGIWRPGSGWCRNRTAVVARPDSAASRKKAISICGVCWSAARWQWSSTRRKNRTSIPGSQSCSAANHRSWWRWRWRTRPQGSPGRSWQAAAHTIPASMQKEPHPQCLPHQCKGLGAGTARHGHRIRRKTGDVARVMKR